jgi:formate-dependent nitrite reductase membrane component NrfD
MKFCFLLIGSSADLGRTYQYLIDSLSSGANICLICIDVIQKTDAVRIKHNFILYLLIFILRFGIVHVVIHHFILFVYKNGLKMEYINPHQSITTKQMLGIGIFSLGTKNKIFI